MTKRLMKRIVAGLLLCGVVGVSVRAFMGGDEAAPVVNSARIAAGSVSETVGATGTLQAVTTVQVGTQVSGIVQELYADFNSLVKQGDVIARLDPSTIETQIEQARANLIRAQADLSRLDVGLEDARNKLVRVEDLTGRGILPKTDLEAAQVAVKLADAQVRSSRAGVTQAEASLNQNLVNLQHTVIKAPIDGLVISRSVDRGQTVAASMSAPTLFVLAADLTKMQVVASLDESDVGRIRPGQTVAFSVDAYPNDTFAGRVAQVRLQPIVTSNVVTYATVIDVPNPELKLKPGMTANVTVQIASRDRALLVPNAALRFRPTAATYAALGIAAPNPPAATARALPETDGEGRPGDAPAGPGAAAVAAATTVDALFGPLPEVETNGRVWVLANGALTVRPVRLGITDGQRSELIAGELEEGAEVITGVVAAGAPATRTTSPTSTPSIFNGGGRGGRF